MSEQHPSVKEHGPLRRVLVIDDSSVIHDDFRKILDDRAADGDLADMESILFGAEQRQPIPDSPRFELDFAHQGEEGIAKVEKSLSEGNPYSVIFIDVRMPPGLDGILTLERIFALDSAVQAVLCTAYSDYGWGQLRGRFGNTDRLLVLRKPFEAIEVAQLALSLTEKWHRERQISKLTGALQQSEAQIRALLDAVPDVLLRVDHQGNIRWQRLRRSSDAASSDGGNWDAICTKSQQRSILGHLDDAFRSGFTQEVLLTVDGGSESGPDMHVYIAPLGNTEAIILLRDVSKLRQAEQDGVKQRARELALEMKLEELAKLSTPMIPLREGVLVVPVVGEIDERRAQRLRESLLDNVVAQRTELVILDLTGLPRLDAVVATELTRTAQATRLLGAQIILSGLSAQAARQVVSLGISFQDVRVVRSLQSAIEWALNR